ncbi:MAG: DUF5819 family protein [Bacteroidota bacterium]
MPGSERIMRQPTRYQKVIFLLGTAALVLHFIMTIIYVLPYEYRSGAWAKPVHYYMTPVFEQSWRLFAPEPPVKGYRFEYRVLDAKGNWSPWVDPGTELIAQHHRYRVSYHALAVEVYQSIPFNLQSSYERLLDKVDTTIHDPEVIIQTYPAYQLAARYALDHAHASNPDVLIEAVQFRNALHQVDPQSQGYPAKPLRIDYTAFPEFAVSNEASQQP